MTNSFHKSVVKRGLKEKKSRFELLFEFGPKKDISRLLLLIAELRCPRAKHTGQRETDRQTDIQIYGQDMHIETDRQDKNSLTDRHECPFRIPMEGRTSRLILKLSSRGRSCLCVPTLERKS